MSRSPAAEAGVPAALAAAHRELHPGRVFVDRASIADLEHGLDRARLRFARIPLDAPSERTAAEWLFDNDYLLRRVLTQLRREFPSGYQRRLPSLADGRPRLAAVAEAILDAPGDLELAGIDAFVREYQEVAELTMAELWALPVLLRWVILNQLIEAFEGDPADRGAAVGRGVRALRLLAEIDVKALFSRHSAVERLLCEDPAGAYDAMDFETRDAYRHSVEDLTRDGGGSEGGVARTALALARGAPPDGRRDHVGFWLVDRGRGLLERRTRARRRDIGRLIRRNPRAWFFGALVATHLALLAPVFVHVAGLAAHPVRAAAVIALCWIPASVPAVALVHWLVSKLLRPAQLPKLDFGRGIPTRWRTIVAVPALLDSAESIDRLAERLEVHFLGNPDPQLGFALLTDHVDLPGPPGPQQDVLVERARRRVRELNARHGGDAPGPFHLLHRASRYNPAERCWMGWERKRGKLEELNRLLRGDAETTFELHEGDRSGLEGVAFVLTLDADTQLPPGAAVRLVGALAHPLNRPGVGRDGTLNKGYTILQPRVEVSPRSARRSLFTALFAGDTGIDIYTHAVSEAYQDLFGEGIYVGKGIYDVDAFGAALEGRVPDNSLVSHDLFEGIHGRAGLVTDVVVYEDYPPHYAAYLHRLHRWVRGDWQLLPWLGWRVPRADGTRGPNGLGFVARFKILDNLRRTLVAPSLLALLVAAWFGLLGGHPLVWTLAALLAGGAPALIAGLERRAVPRADLGRWLALIGSLVPESLVVLDAVGRTLWRLLSSRRRLLEWVTAADAARRLATGRGSYLRQLWTAPAAALALAAALGWLAPWTLPWAGPVLILWLFVPEIAYRIGQPTRREDPPLDAPSRRYLRRTARRTWLFFETFVGPADQWLAPDHFQEHPRHAIAHRTSPTDIGMGLLSELGAYDLGYVGVDELATRVGNTLTTVERLERHRGHLLNWYDTRTLAPLEPRYVSTVDSGNLAGALLALAVGCEKAVEDPPVREATRHGMRDAAELLEEALVLWASSTRPGGRAHAALARCRGLVGSLSDPDTAPATWLDATGDGISAIEADLLAALKDGDPVGHDPALLREIETWLRRLAHQLAGARALAETLLPGPLADEPPALAAIPGACADEGAATRARALGQTLRALAHRARALADSMELGFLFDPERCLFHIGYDVGEDRLDPHHYDLLASEARLASFLAVMRREVPPTHWFKLGRPLAATHAGPVLLSWGGSMFEYLMPRLLMRSPRDTLLDRSCAAAVARQIEYGSVWDRPWGISESGYAFLDAQQGYQYRSFGVPGLGLRRGLDEDLVVAPYASLLALPFAARAVVENLRALEALGMFGRYGFYEAADFHTSRATGGRVSIVREHMSHHLGMGLVAVVNELCDDRMVDRFHADPRVEATALLLAERAPREAPPQRPPPEHIESTDVGLTAAPSVAGWEPAPHAMSVWALGNGAWTTWISSRGGGGASCSGRAVTRWRPDRVSEPFGAWIYLVDLDTGARFGATPAPLGGWPADGRVRFAPGRVDFVHRRDRLSIHLVVSVSPTEDVEVRELRITNEGDTPRRLRVVSCLEPVLEPVGAAERHPAFSKLFLRVEPQGDLGGFVVTREVREGLPAPVLAHRMIADGPAAPRSLTADREAFLGRWGSYADPAALRRAPPVAGAGATLDPICALEVEVELDPGTRRSVGWVTGLGATRVDALERVGRFASPSAVRWAIDDAEAAGDRRAARVGLGPPLLTAAHRVLSALLIGSEPALRAPPATLSAGRPGPRALWGRGISGDEPIVAIRVRGSERSALLDDVLRVHRYLRAVGAVFDLVLVDHVPSGYEDEAARGWEHTLGQHRMQHLLHKRGGVHLLRVDQTGEQDLLDVLAAARVVLDGRGGHGLAQLLGAPPEPRIELPDFAPPGSPPGAPPDPDLALGPDGELELADDLGGFAGDEFVIRPDARTPAPWCNVLANADFGCLTSEGGLGSTWSLDAGENRLTPWHNDPVIDPPSEVLYLRDEETGRLWSATPLPCGPPARVRHGAGYTTYESACAGLRVRATVFVPPDAPVKVVRLTIDNAGSRPRRLTATYYAEWVLGERREQTAPHIRTEALPEESCLLATCPWSLEYAGRVAFLATDRPVHGFTADRVEVLGPGGDLARPAGLLRWGLGSRTEPTADPCAALQCHLDLPAEGRTEVCFFLGQEEDRDAAIRRIRSLSAAGASDEAWRARGGAWDRWLDAVRVRTPDPALDRMLNRWLPYQTLASRFFGRTGYYQSSGAYGFRDQLQDALALLHLDPALARAHLLECAAHQFVEGDVLHWWHPHGGAGVRTRCSDDLLWLVYVTAAYVEATGDEDVLRVEVPFLQAEPLEPGETARYGQFAEAAGASLLEHCRRALTRGWTEGPHGLPLIGDGDWNDGMNRVGDEGRGESVWLGWFLHVCAERFSALLERLGDGREAKRWREPLPKLARAIEMHGWDGGWYRRAFHDDGTPIGSAHTRSPHIDSIAQSWAAISGAGDPARVEGALRAVDKLLVREEERLVLLLAPPFGRESRDAGYIQAYPPGVRENGGQYTHAAAWLGWAHAARGDGAAAARVLDLLCPSKHEDRQRYRVEPYVIAADVYGRPPFVGRGGWTWYTGAAAWTWRLGVEAILGLRRVDGALEVDPCLPPDWPGYEAWVRYPDGEVHVVVDNRDGIGRGVREARIDGRLVPAARVERTQGSVRLHVVLGAASVSMVPAPWSAA